jgi:CRP-like cAMP-binding protein
MNASQPTPFGPRTLSPDDSTQTGSRPPVEEATPFRGAGSASFFLREIRAFDDLPTNVLEVLSARLQRRDYAPASLIVQQGKQADELIILAEGTAVVRLDRPAERESVVLNQLQPGCIVGEISMVTREPCTASVEAMTPVTAYALSASDFRELSQAHPIIAVAMTHLISSRLGKAQIDALCGKVVRDYHVEDRLGRGGMAVVYRAVRTSTGEPVALKMMDPEYIYDRNANQRFQREASVGMTLKHPGIVRVHEQFSAYQTQFFVMDYCGGGTLAHRMRRGKPLAIAESRRILAQIAESLTYAHSQGVVHRDLKPGNILFDDAGNVRLADFGLARAAAEPSLTQTGQVLGTPRYMPPEQLTGEIADARADIYALGCIAFELFAGGPPFLSGDFASLFKEKMEWTLPLAEEIHAEITPELYDFLLGSLHPSAKERLSDMRLLM